jgi:hypothetical protein
MTSKPFGSVIVYSCVCGQLYIGCFFSCLTDKRRPDALVSFIRLSTGYHHCDRLSSSRRGLLNLPDTRRTMQHWQSLGQSVGPALIGQAVKKTPCTS